MMMTEYLMAHLEREADGTRRTLERLPEGRNDYRARDAEFFLAAIPLVTGLAGLFVSAIANSMFLMAWRLGAGSGTKPLGGREHEDL